MLRVYLNLNLPADKEVEFALTARNAGFCFMSAFRRFTFVSVKKSVAHSHAALRAGKRMLRLIHSHRAVIQNIFKGDTFPGIGAGLPVSVWGTVKSIIIHGSSPRYKTIIGANGFDYELGRSFNQCFQHISLLSVLKSCGKPIISDRRAFYNKKKGGSHV